LAHPVDMHPNKIQLPVITLTIHQYTSIVKTR